MNIAYILNDTPVNSGATKAFVNMLEGLKTYDVKPFVVVPNKQGIYIELKKQGIPVLATPYRPCSYPYSNTMQQKLFFIPRLAARIIANAAAIKKVETFLRGNKINLVHSNTSVVSVGFDAARRVGIPHLYHIREYGDRDFGIHYFPNKASFYRQLAADNCYTACITKDIQEYHHQRGMASSRVIYDGVFSKKTEIPISTSKNYFLFAGRIQPAKSLDVLLDAYKTYKDGTNNPLPLKVAGSNGDTAHYEQLLRFVKEYGLTDFVHFLGERNDIANLMRDARALIIPSRSEGFGFCMPEAMQQGTLCIAHDTGGTKEQLDNALELTGKEIALRYDTTEQLAQLLKEVTVHPAEYYDAYRERAFLVVNKLYTQESNARQVYTFYKDILKENK